MHEIGFIRDLAMVMLVAGTTTILFQRLHQPVLLGYILAGVLIGPHTPGVLVADPRAIDDISNLGVVLLMFTLGLEFSVRKLRKVGIGVLAVAVGEVGLMLWIGAGIGGLFGWKGMDALFLGAIISLSSTMVATRTLAEGGQRHQRFAQLVVGLLVAEDMLAIVMLTLLTAVAIGGSVHAEAAFTLIGHLGLFVVVGMILGLLLLPRLVDYVAGFGRDETLLVSVLGICFGASPVGGLDGFQRGTRCIPRRGGGGRIAQRGARAASGGAIARHVRGAVLRGDRPEDRPSDAAAVRATGAADRDGGDHRQDAGMQSGYLRGRSRCTYGAALGAGHGADRRILVRDRHARTLAGRHQ